MTNPVINTTFSEKEYHDTLPMNVTRRANVNIRPFYLSRDRSYMLALNSTAYTKIQQSTDDGNTWTPLDVVVSGYGAVGAVETDDGGILLSIGSGAVIKATGASWGTTAATRKAAVFTTVIAAGMGGWVDWSIGHDCVGSNGVVTACLYATQSSSGVPADNVATGRYLYASLDHGNTFKLVFDLALNPASIYTKG